MSGLGNVLASSVAGAPLQAQQAARQRERQTAETAHQAQRLRELVELHLRALEEGDERDATPAQLHIDGQLPEHHGQPHQEPKATPLPAKAEEEGGAATGVAGLAGNKTISAEPRALYRHLDVQA